MSATDGTSSPDTTSHWMIYGANGYTGRLIAKEAARRSLRPILAGRNRQAMQSLGDGLDLPTRVFALDEPSEIARNLQGVSLVLHCAGPFVATSPSMMRACIEARAHYLDITGEIDVIELAASLDGQARRAGVTILPAVGFDVVPTDCLAAKLAAELPGANLLQLAITGGGTVSPGTARTMLETIPTGGRARIDGRIERVPPAWKARDIAFRRGTLRGVTIPWGDVASAFYSTGIPNIETYLGMTSAEERRWRRLTRLTPLLRVKLLRKIAHGFIAKTMKGPTEEQRRTDRAEVWGRVSRADGESHEATIETPNGYQFTVLSSLAVVERMLAEGSRAGFFTPSKAFGAEFVYSLPGVN